MLPNHWTRSSIVPTISGSASSSSFAPLAYLLKYSGVENKPKVVILAIVLEELELLANTMAAFNPLIFNRSR